MILQVEETDLAVKVPMFQVELSPTVLLAQPLESG